MNDDNKEYEGKITKLVAETCRFELREKDAVCRICGKRFLRSYAGTPLNERMLSHFGGHANFLIIK